MGLGVQVSPPVKHPVRFAITQQNCIGSLVFTTAGGTVSFVHVNIKSRLGRCAQWGGTVLSLLDGTEEKQKRVYSELLSRGALLR